MSEQRVGLPYANRHVLSFAAYGTTAAEVEADAFQRAAAYFGLLLGDKINEVLVINIASESHAVQADGEVLVYKAAVTAMPR